MRVQLYGEAGKAWKTPGSGSPAEAEWNELRNL